MIEPERFEQLADAVDAALGGSAEADLPGIVAELGALPAVERDEEPEGAGFYAGSAAAASWRCLHLRWRPGQFADLPSNGRVVITEDGASS